MEVSEVCSGLEGVGLMLAFSGAWLLYFRREYFLPRALLLVPVGVAAILRSTFFASQALMWIGDAGFPDVAVYGFHIAGRLDRVHSGGGWLGPFEPA